MADMELGETREFAVGAYTVIYHRWHSDYMDEDFTATTVFGTDGHEVMHAGMGVGSKADPDQATADADVESYREIVEHLGALSDE